MSHSLIHQTKDKPRRSFGIVKERIVTTQPCSVIEEQQLGGQFGISFSFCGSTTSKVHDQDPGVCYPATPAAVRLLQRGVIKSESTFPQPQVSLKDNASLTKDSNVTMQIPTHSTIAFALDELEIRHDGHFGENGLF